MGRSVISCPPINRESDRHAGNITGKLRLPKIIVFFSSLVFTPIFKRSKTRPLFRRFPKPRPFPSLPFRPTLPQIVSRFTLGLPKRRRFSPTLDSYRSFIRRRRMKGTATSMASALHESPTKPVQETRKILGPGGNQARVSAAAKPAGLAKLNGAPEKPVLSPAKIMRAVSKVSEAGFRKNRSVDSSCSTDSSSSSSSSSLSSVSAKTADSSRNLKLRVGSVKPVPAGAEAAAPVASGPTKRCDWITANSDPLYISFHDEEWGVQVHDDSKLYELLVLSIALAEHTWVSILTKRALFRTLFDDFNPASVAEFSEGKLMLLCTDENALLSESKLRAVVENAKQIIKVQEEFGSFSNYCWRFVNNQPMRNGYRYSRQVPIKTPKAELISKDLMRRGFRCVGPTVVYSFMQVSGMVNDHLTSCFRYQGCRELI